MKKIAFFIDEYMPYFDLIKFEAQKESIPLEICLYNDVQMSFAEGKTIATLNGGSLKDYNLAFFRNLDKHGEMHITLSELFQQMNVKVLDKALRYKSPWIASKNFVYTRLSHYGLPIIDSEFVSISNYAVALGKINFPCIAKITHGAGGEGVYLCQNEEEIRAIFEKHRENLILQNFIENDGDLRIFVIGDQVIGVMKRIRVGNSEFRNNISLGGEAISFDATPEIIAIATKAASVLGYAMAGVDLIFDAVSKSWKIIEVNKSPQYSGIMKATGINVPNLLVKFLKSEAVL